MTATFNKTINTQCDGFDCEYNGPSIMINEIMISPSQFDGSISGEASPDQKGEWIELFNPHLCEPVDISCYYLGSAAKQSGSTIEGEAFQLPNNTIVPPAGFCVVRGVNSTPVPANLLVANGGNTIEVIVPGNITGNGICISGPNPLRLWFPNAGGWFAFYDNNGVVQDAISWGTEEGRGNNPCVPTHSSCNSNVTSLQNYNNFPSSRKQKIYTSGVPNSWGNSIRRIPDGGSWAVNQGSSPTQGNCNSVCVQILSSTCDGQATINVLGGSGNYTYNWNDSEAQTTQTADGLCAGIYTVLVTDLVSGNVQSFTVEIVDYVPAVTFSVNDEFCSNDPVVPIAGFSSYSPIPNTGQTAEFLGAGVTNNSFNPSITGAGSFPITYRFTDENGCSNTAVDNVLVNPIPTFSSNVSDDNCERGEGEIIITPNAGLFPYQYSIDNGVNMQNHGTFQNLIAGTYNVVVIDDKGCEASGNIVLNTTITPDPSFTLTNFCEGENNAASNVAAAGGVFSIVTPLNDGATVNPNSGIISNGVGGTTYTLEYEFISPCASLSTENVTVFSNPVYSLSSIDPTCDKDNGSITISGLNASTTYGLTYSVVGNGISFQNVITNGAGEIRLDNLPVGSYTNFQITNSNGCTTTDPTIINLVNLGRISITAPDDIDMCIGESVSLTVDNPDGGTISWNNGVIDGQTFTPPSSGSTTYTVTGVSSIGCVYTDEVTVTVHEHPTVFAGVDQEICKDDLTTLTASGAQTYIWTGLGTGQTQVVSPTINTTYRVDGYDQYGCTNFDYVEVVVNPLPEPQFIADTLEGCEPVTVNFTNLSNVPGGTCVWSFGDGKHNNSCADVTHTYKSGGSFNVSLTITDLKGCIGVETKNSYINVRHRPRASFFADPLVTETFNTLVYFTNTTIYGTAFTWTFGDGSPDAYSYNASNFYPVDVVENYNVTLVATNGIDCADTAKAVVKVEEQLIFYVPNTFTPDGNEFNSVFKPIFSSGFDEKSYVLSIYNRWGELIFESHDTNIGWDGSYGMQNVKNAPEGTYVWTIQVKEKKNDKHNTYSGHVNLLK